mgnify:CR=1 FL=1
MISAVLDTNILASGALTSPTIPGQILNEWQDGQFEMILSQHIINELERTLNKPYFRNLINTQDIDAFLDLLRNEATLTTITTKVRRIATHPEDDLVLATAESGKAAYVVTGDHGLQDLKQFKDIKVVSPRTFAEILQAEKAA